MAISGLVTNNRGYLTHAFTFMGGDIHTVVTADRGQSGKTGSTRVKAKAKAKRATGDDDEEEAEEREPKGARPGATSGDAHGAERPKMTFAQFASEMQTVTTYGWGLGVWELVVPSVQRCNHFVLPRTSEHILNKNLVPKRWWTF